jgi:threonine aldolase
MIDLRSDTVTLPTPAMREAMANAGVGDDVLREDPTVNRLEEETAALLGKEAALFVPSGTMSNQLAVWVSTGDGEEIVVEKDCHITNYEAGGPALLARVMVKPLAGARGVITARQVREAVNPDNVHLPVTRLVCVENTHNRAGGTVFPLEELARVGEACRALGLLLHVDGARLWNASVATGVPEREYARHADSVSVCFSKGLGAPVGSCLCGTRALVERARRRRKTLGGGMRQAGILAAGALHALHHHRDRLAEDHAAARRLAAAAVGMPGFAVDLPSVMTNIVVVEVTPPASQVVAALREEGLLCHAIRPGAVRLVTHLGLGPADIDNAIDIMGRVAGRPRSAWEPPGA